MRAASASNWTVSASATRTAPKETIDARPTIKVPFATCLFIHPPCCREVRVRRQRGGADVARQSVTPDTQWVSTVVDTALHRLRREVLSYENVLVIEMTAPGRRELVFA